MTSDPRWLLLTTLLLGACPASEAPTPDLDLQPAPDSRVVDRLIAREKAVTDHAPADHTAPATPWSKQLGTSGEDHARAVALDGAGNVYVAGFTDGAISGATSAGAEDILVIKLDPDGKQLWARQLGSAGRELVLGMAVDAQGQVYAAGSTTGDLKGQNAGNDGTCKDTNCPDLFVVKLSSSGSPLWTQQLGTKGDDTANGIALDATGVYVTGKTAGDLDGHKSAGWNDVFLIKYSLDGSKLWSQQFGNYSFDEGRAVAADGKGTVLVTGYLAPKTGNDDIFLSARSGDSGAELWQRTLTSPGIVNEEGYAVAVDSAGITVCGYTMGALPGNTATSVSDLFVARYDPSGTQLWVTQIGAADTGGVSFSLAKGVVVAGGAVYATGFTNGDLGPTPLGGYDLFLLKIGLDGSKGPVQVFGSAEDDRGHAIAAGAGRLVLAGDTEGSVDGNPSLGGSDILVKQLGL
jgi:hypothetical protein